MTILGENGDSISPGVGVNEVDGTLQGVSADDQHDWSENLFVVAVDTSAHIIDDSWTNPVSIGISFNLDTSSIKEEIAVFSARSDQAVDLLQVLGIVSWCDIMVF